MTDPIVVLRKLVVLRDHLARARQRRPDTARAFGESTLLQDALAMSLLVAIQEAIDIAFHIAADEGWGMPGSHAEAFTILADHGVLPKDLVEPLEAMARLRNRIAHGYASVDADRIWHELPAGFAALERFVVAIAKLVDERDVPE